MAHPQSVVDWERIARRYASAAKLLVDSKHSNQAWLNAGFAIEAALKGAVMRHQRYNSWPSKERDARLYTHDLNYLLREAGIDRNLLTQDPVAPMFHVALAWLRSDGYDPTPMPMKRAEDMVTSMREVLEWINKRFQMAI